MQSLTSSCPRLDSSIQPPNSSFPRKRECGFTFEVQHLVPESLSGSIVAEGFTRGIVVSLHQLSKPIVRHGDEVGLARQSAAQATDGVLDATLLPRRVGIAEEGLETEGMELVMLGELGAVVESNGLTPLRRERAENGRHGVGNRVGFFRRGSGC